MGAQHAARVVTRRRPKWRAYLLLSRLSNLPTIWTNVLAGLVASHSAFRWNQVVHLSIAVSLFYTAGMFLNDAFDREFDAAHRPDRPLPSGDVSPFEVFGIGFALLAAGEVWVAFAGDATALVWGLALSAAILYYSYRHKRDPLGPLVMGVCRGLVYCVAAAAVSGGIAPQVVGAAAVVTAYVVALTWVSKRVAQRAGWLIPLLVAGIALVDASIMLANGGAALAMIGAVGFILTLVLQRLVPGT